MARQTEDDEQLFRREMRDVRPLPDRRQVVATRRTRAPRKPNALEEAELRADLTAPASPDGPETGEELLYRTPSLSPLAFRRLRRGEWTVEAELDLHGNTAAEAHNALARFIELSAQRGLRCVRVVHGKGMRSGPRGPVLKHLVDQWLRRWHVVLGFASTPTHDGGTGAIYVLLRRT